MKKKTDPHRAPLAAILGWRDAHATFDDAVKGLPSKLAGVRPKGLPHSVWELVEHVRLAQRDILDFCRDPDYRAPKWPDDYWPASPQPPSARALAASVQAVRADRRAFERLAADPDVDLFAKIPHGDGQTVLREILLAADHSAYHVGQIVLVRKLLGAWG